MRPPYIAVWCGQCLSGVLEDQDIMEQNKQIMLRREDLPVLADCDLLVVGGSFAGIAAALAAAEAGLSVVLVEPRTYLGREASACLRPFTAMPGAESIPDLLQSSIEAAGMAFADAGVITFRAGDLKTHLEDRLLAAGVKIIYASQPAGLHSEAGCIRGVIFGNKSGRQVVRARVVIDATDPSLLFQLAGSRKPLRTEMTALFYRTLEFVKVGAVAAGTITVPEELEVAGNVVRLVPGAHGEDHWFVTCAMSLPGSAQDAFDLTKREITARKLTMLLAAYLRKNVPGFEKAYLAGASQQLAGPTYLVWEGKAERASAQAKDCIKAGYGLPQIQLLDTLGPLVGLFALNGSLWPGHVATDKEIFAAIGYGEAFSHWMVERMDALPAVTEVAHAQAVENADGQAQKLPDFQVMEPESPQRGKTYPMQRVEPNHVQVLREVDVLVIGGGTSGATAAYAAAKNGARTLLIEALPGLGGTGTIGGVHSYWFGRRVGFSRQVIDAVEAMHAEMGLEPPQGGLLKWNIEAKMHALTRRAQDAGVEMLWGAVATGAVVEGNRVRGIVAATPLGPAALLAEVIIDATGDGDVAAFAGAPVVYGASRDHVTMWYSLAQFHTPGMTRNNFTSMVDVGNVEDYSRAIMAGRRRVQGYDQGTYVAPRESRHVVADVVLSLNDQLLRRRWEDTVYVAFSNHDVKGHSSSDWLRIGLIPPNLEVEIPYRALLPKGLEGILITGKAISATHDALPAVRMQPDMENMGGVAGTAAAMAVKAGSTPREIDVRALQKAMVSVGALPEGILNRTLTPRVYTEAELESLVEQMVGGKPLYDYQDMDLDVIFEGSIPFAEICTVGPKAVAVLARALKQRRGPERVIIAKALAMTGSSEGVEDLIAALHEMTPDEGLQVLNAHIRHTQLPPDQGAMPEAVNLLYALGMTRDTRTLPIWDHFSTLIGETSEDDIRDRRLGLFYYVDAICFGAERLGDINAAPFLKRIHAHPSFHSRSTPEGFEPDYFLERMAYLELVVGRALARLGDREGFDVLIRFLTDARALLAEHAHSELRAITGEDFGKNPERWQAWLAESSKWRSPHPVEANNEAVQAWDEVILWEE